MVPFGRALERENERISSGTDGESQTAALQTLRDHSQPRVSFHVNERPRGKPRLIEPSSSSVMQGPAMNISALSLPAAHKLLLKSFS